MKKINAGLLIFTLSLLSVFCVCAGDMYQSNTGYLYQAAVYDTGNEGLGLKASPDINSQRYFYIPDGTILNIDQISGNWGHTFYNGTGGWIALKYTRVIGDYRSDSPSYGQISPAYYIVHDTEGEGLEQRISPTSESSTFGPAYDSAIALVTAIQNEWAYASCNGHYGWMNLTYLRPWDASSSNFQACVYDTKGQGLSLRSAPELNSGSYLSLPDETVINIDDISYYGWGHTYYNGTGGWILLKNTRLSGNYPSQIPSGSLYSALIQYMVVNTEGEGLELRTGPDTVYSTFGPLYDGTVVFVHATLNDWAYVYCNGHFGWANLTFLQQVQRSADSSSALQADQPSSTPSISSVTSIPAAPSIPAESDTPALSSTVKDPEAAFLSAQASADNIVVSANIAEYNGITYMLPRGNDLNRLTDLPVTPAIYPYVCAFAFYNDRIYYCSKQAGTSDYQTALCTCLPDGTDQKILIDSAQTGDIYYYTNFVINDNKIYFTQYSSGNTAYCYYDINTDSIMAYADPGQEITDHLDNMRTKVTAGSETYYIGDSNGSGSSGKTLYYSDANGNNVLLATSEVMAIEAITSDCVYFSKFNSGSAELYRVFRGTLAVEYIDGHIAVGGGIYFNW